MKHNNFPASNAASRQENRALPAEVKRAHLMSVLGAIGAVGDKMQAATAPQPQRDTSPRTGQVAPVTGREATVKARSLKEVLSRPSERTVVEWTKNESLGPTSTVTVNKPGTVIPAEALTGQTIVVKNDKGWFTTDFRSVVRMPERDKAGNYRPLADQQMRVAYIEKNPVIGHDILVGAPWNGGLVEEITISGDAFATGGAGTGEHFRDAALPFDHPNQRVNAPDPTLIASDLLDRAQAMKPPRL